MEDIKKELRRLLRVWCVTAMEYLDDGTDYAKGKAEAYIQAAADIVSTLELYEQTE